MSVSTHLANAGLLNKSVGDLGELSGMPRIYDYFCTSNKCCTRRTQFRELKFTTCETRTVCPDCGDLLVSKRKRGYYAIKPAIGC